MAAYVLHLGFNWNSPEIGTLFNDGGALDARFLQFALADASANPAWFTRFENGDIIVVQVHCLSGYASGMSSLVLRLAFGPVTVGATALATYPPDAIVDAPLMQLVDGNLVLDITSSETASSGGSPWPGTEHTWTMDPAMTIAETAPGYSPLEAGFSVEVTLDNETRKFVADPEMIIGEG